MSEEELVEAALAALSQREWDHAAVSALLPLCANEEGCSALHSRRSELLPTVAAAVTEGAETAAEGVVNLVSLLASVAQIDPWGLTEVVQSGGVTALAALIPSTPEEVREPCLAATGAFSQLARMPDGRRSMMGEALPKLAGLLNSSLDAQALRPSCPLRGVARAHCIFPSHRVCCLAPVALYHCVIQRWLCPHMSSEPCLMSQVELQAEAARALADCASAAVVRAALRGEQVVEAAVARLRAITAQPASEVGSADATLAARLLVLLSRLGQDGTLSARMLERDLTRALMAALQWPLPPPPAAPEAATPGAGAGKPSKTDKSQAAAAHEVEAGAEDGVRLRDEIVSGAALCVAVCARASASWRVALRQAGSLQALAAALSSGGVAAPQEEGSAQEGAPDPRRLALPAVANCCVALTNCLLEISWEEAPQLTALADALLPWMTAATLPTEEPPPDSPSHTTAAPAAADPQVGDESTLAAAALGLAALCEYPEAADRIISRGALPSFVEVVRNHTRGSEARAASAHALCRLCARPECRAELVQRRALLEAIVEVLDEPQGHAAIK